MGHPACCVHSECMDGLSAAGRLDEPGIFYSAVDVYTRLGYTATAGKSTKHGLSDGAQAYGLHPLRPVTVAGFNSAPNKRPSPCYKYLLSSPTTAVYTHCLPHLRPCFTDALITLSTAHKP